MSFKNLSMDEELFQTMVNCTVVVILKQLATNFLTGLPKAKLGMRPPEDSGVLRFAVSGLPQQSFGIVQNVNDDDDSKKKKELEKAKLDLARYTAVINNDLENIASSLVLFWVAAFATSHPNILRGLIILFTIGRVAHSVAYLLAIPGIRSLVFLTAYFSTVAAGVLAWIK